MTWPATTLGYLGIHPAPNIFVLFLRLRVSVFATPILCVWVPLLISATYLSVLPVTIYLHTVLLLPIVSTLFLFPFHLCRCRFPSASLFEAVTYVLGAAVVMDLDAVDYSDEPLEEGSIWKSSYAASEGMLNYSAGFNGNFDVFPQFFGPANSAIVLPDEPPAWPAFSLPLPSSTSLGFITGCINPSPELEAPYSDPQPHLAEQLAVVPSVEPLNNDPNPSSIFAPLSSCFTFVPPLSDAIPEIPTNPNPLTEDPNSTRVSEEPHISASRPQKKHKCFKSKVDDAILKLEEDIQWGDTMDYADRVLVGRIRGRNYSAACLKTWAQRFGVITWRTSHLFKHLWGDGSHWDLLEQIIRFGCFLPIGTLNMPLCY